MNAATHDPRHARGLHARGRDRVVALSFAIFVLFDPTGPLRGAEPPEAAFKGLTSVQVGRDLGSGACAIHYDPALAQSVPAPIASPSSSSHPVVTLRLRQGGPPFDIHFSMEPSYDPSFVVVPAGKPINIGSPTGELAANTLFIPGNGFLYTAGATNQTFDVRRKFRVSDLGQCSEIRQPFYAVQLDTTTRRGVTLTAQPEGGDEVASVPAGDPVTVLLWNGKAYLIRTRFGLIGWLVIPEGDSEPAIVGLEYKGD